MEDILIDTDIVIEYLRNKDKSSTQLIKMIRKHDLFLSSITEFELFLGAKTERHRLDLEMLFNEIVRYDCAHGFFHRDMIYPKDKKEKHLSHLTDSGPNVFIPTPITPEGISNLIPLYRFL